MVITSPCQPDVPLVIRGVNDAAICQRCQNRLLISLIGFNREAGGALKWDLHIQQPTIVSRNEHT